MYRWGDLFPRAPQVARFVLLGRFCVSLGLKNLFFLSISIETDVQNCVVPILSLALLKDKLRTVTAYPGVRDNRSTINTKTGYGDTGITYCFYSVVQNWVICPTGATRCPDKRETWHRGADSSAKFHVHWGRNDGIEPPKLSKF